MLGAHLKPKDSSVFAYSRDVLAGPMRRLYHVIEDIRNKKFDPDATRSGRWVSRDDEDRAEATEILAVPARQVGLVKLTEARVDLPVVDSTPVPERCPRCGDLQANPASIFPCGNCSRKCCLDCSNIDFDSAATSHGFL